MPILTKVGWYITASLAALALAGCTWMGWYVQGLRAENESLGTANAALTADLAASRQLREADQAVAQKHAQRVAKMTTIQKATDAKLYRALEQNAAWAGQRVPDDVADALGLLRTANP